MIVARDVLLVLSLVTLVGVCTPARADTCDNYKTPSQVLAGLTSENAAANLQAKTCGLNSSDRSVRGVVLQRLLVGVRTLSFTVVPKPEDNEGAALVDRLPALGVFSVDWGRDGKSFGGGGIGGQVGAVGGTFLGEGLQLTYTSVKIAADKPDGQPVFTSCDAHLTLPQGGAELSGDLRCSGFRARPIISLGL